MHWYQGDEEEEDIDLMFSPALLARRASESWIDSAPIEVNSKFFFLKKFLTENLNFNGLFVNYFELFQKFNNFIKSNKLFNPKILTIW